MKCSPCSGLYCLSLVSSQRRDAPAPTPAAGSSQRAKAKAFLPLPALLLIAVCVRILYGASLAPSAPIASIDAWGYHRLALNLDLGNGFSLHRSSPFVPDSVRTPLYPVFLLGIRRTLDPSPQTATVVQAILDGLTTLLTYTLAVRLADRRAGRIAALLYALNPTQVRYANELLTETMLSFLVVLCMVAIVTYIRLSQTQAARQPKGALARSPLVALSTAPQVWLAISAILASLSILCKPNAQFLPVILAVAIATTNPRRWRRAVVDISVVFAIVAAILLPWFVRNHQLFGRWFLSTAFEGNVSRISAPATIAQSQMRIPAPWSDEWEGDFLGIVSQAATQYKWQKPWDALTAREQDRQNHQVYLVARQLLLRHPVAWITSHIQGMLRYLEPQTYKICYASLAGQDWPADIRDHAPLHVVRWISGRHWREAWQVIRQERWQKLDRLQGTVYYGMFCGQIIGLVLGLRGIWTLRRRPAVAAVLLLTIGYMLFLPGPIAYERFRVPVMSLILSLIATNAPRTQPA